MTTVHCNVHDADTTVSETKIPIPKFFTVGCAYCMEIENRLLRTKLEQATKQRDTLVEAIDIAKTVRITQ
jgi:hypothetical protein